jgi:hypothetical protein
MFPNSKGNYFTRNLIFFRSISPCREFSLMQTLYKIPSRTSHWQHQQEKWKERKAGTITIPKNRDNALKNVFSLQYLLRAIMNKNNSKANSSSDYFCHYRWEIQNPSRKYLIGNYGTFYVLYAPISAVWFWYCLRSWSYLVFQFSNPTIEFGGLSKEKAKRKCYDQLPPDLVPRTIYITHDLTYQEVIQKVRDGRVYLSIMSNPTLE